jgi:hypothetical protein
MGMIDLLMDHGASASGTPYDLGIRSTTCQRNDELVTLISKNGLCDLYSRVNSPNRQVTDIRGKGRSDEDRSFFMFGSKENNNRQHCYFTK